MAFKFLNKLNHPILSPDPNEDNNIRPQASLWARKKMSPEDYVNTISGQYGHDHFWHINKRNDFGKLLKESKHNTPANNDKALKSLLGHVKAHSSRPDEYDENKHIESANAKDLILEIAADHPVSAKALDYLIDHPMYINHDPSILAKQPNLNKEHLRKIIDSYKEPLGDLINNPAFDREMAQHRMSYPDKIDDGDMRKLLDRSKHSDPNKRLIDQKDIEHLLLEHKLNTKAAHHALNALQPEKDANGEEDHSKKKTIVNKLLGIEGGKHINEREDVDHPDEFGYNNWHHGKFHNKDYANEIASSDDLTPDQIDHIKRHGTFGQKWELFNNPKIDRSHQSEMYDKWMNDDSDKGYDLSDFQDKIKEENPYEKHYEHFDEEARDKASEQYPWDEYLSDQGVDNFEDLNDRDKDQLYEGYDDSIRDNQQNIAERLYDHAMDNAHEDYDYLPEHLMGHLPHVEAKEKERKADEEEKARIEAEEAERKAKTSLDAQMPNRDNKHAYGDLQHHIEMAQDYAKANGGQADIGHLNKLHPSLKEVWKKIFDGKGKLSTQELDQKHQEVKKIPFNISYGQWNGMQNLNNRQQAIIRLDHSPESLAPIKADESLHNTFRKLQDVSQRSGHPTNHNTIAWARVDATDPKHWMVDETQSDFSSAARDYLGDNGKPEEAANIDKIIKYHKNWREALLNKVINLAKQNGVEKVSTHSPESKAAHTGASTVHSVYKDSYQKVPRAMGFKGVPGETLPLSEKGQEMFLKSKSGTSTESLIDDHAVAMKIHAIMHHWHLAIDPHPSTAKAHEQLADHHKEMYKKHQERLATLDPTRQERRLLTPGQYVDQMAPAGAEDEHIKNTASRDADLIVQGGGLPAYTHDSALKEEPAQETMQEGHTYDIKPEAIKKSILEAEDLIKSDIDKREAKLKIANTFKIMNDNKKLLEQIKASNPEVYNTLTNLVQSMVDIFKHKTGEDPQDILHQEEIKEQLDGQQQEQQANQEPENTDPESFAHSGHDEPLHRRKMVYAPGSIRQDSHQSARIKDQDGNWKAYGEGLGEPKTQEPQGGNQ